MVSFSARIPSPLKGLMRTTSSSSGAISSSEDSSRRSRGMKKHGKQTPGSAERKERKQSNRRTHHVGTKRTNLVKTFFARINAQDFGAMTDLCTADAMYVCSSDFIIGMQELVPEAHILFEALPDAQFSSRLAEEVTLVETGESYVVLHDYRVGGTHTGAPFQFGPYPSIEASGKCVQTDPCQLRVYFRDDKISRITVRKAGRYTGPAGLYTKLGGLPLV